MRTTLVLDDRLVRQAKRRAADTGITLSQLVNDALREALRPSSEPVPPFRMITYGNPDERFDLSRAHQGDGAPRRYRFAAMSLMPDVNILV